MEFSYKQPDDKNNPLKQFARNLNEEVINNRIDPVIGRDEEIRRVIEIISRKTKNNPVLIGEPGVGKTAIIEGLARRIVNKDVPENLKNKEVYELNLSSLIGGASYQGQFEERLNNLFKQIENANGKIILFIDEIHQIVGLGANGSSNMDAANILKPLMARGLIKIIGATTLNEYRLHIEKDAALERRMQKVLVKEPSKQEAITIMRGLKERWELFHQVKIHDSALVAAVNLSDRYISDRYLPDKAIDLIDEAAAKVKTQMQSCPIELDEINRKIIHVETEKAALKSETDEKSKKALETIEQELLLLKNKQSELNDLWTKQKKQAEKINDLKKEIDLLKKQAETLQSQNNFVKASEILYGLLPEKNKKLLEIEKNNQNNPNKGLIKEVVGVEEVSEVISKATGIPLYKLLSTEKDKLINLKDKLQQGVIGQENAVDLVSSAILRSRAGINNPQRPIGSFLFMGPIGVGKTELAKVLAQELFDTNKALVRFNMSEYMEKHSVAKLIGAPPGYVGYEQAGILTEAIRRKPYSVLLFDEIEKAHPDVLNLLLQVLDDGELKDSQGRLVNFKNTIIILTSNIGAEKILHKKNDEAIAELKNYLKPEFINRIDEIITFNALNESVIKSIIKKQLNELSIRLKNEDYLINFDDSVIEIILKESYEFEFGARPIKRYIQKTIENFLATQIIQDKLLKNKAFKITYHNKKFELTKQ